MSLAHPFNQSLCSVSCLLSNILAIGHVFLLALAVHSFAFLIHAKFFALFQNPVRTKGLSLCIDLNPFNSCVVSKAGSGIVVLTFYHDGLVNGSRFQIHSCRRKVIDTILVEVFYLLLIGFLNLGKNNLLLDASEPLHPYHKVVKLASANFPLPFFCFPVKDLLCLLAVVKLVIDFRMFGQEGGRNFVTVLVVHILCINPVGRYILRTD